MTRLVITDATLGYGRDDPVLNEITLTVEPVRTPPSTGG
jgi:hypothetical protein